VVPRHAVTSRSADRCVDSVRDTLAERVRVYIDSAHDVTEAAKTLYRTLAATDLQNLELPAVEPGETQKLDIGLVVPRATLELDIRRITLIQHACGRPRGIGHDFT
jgi:hypothetical protein